MKSICDWKPPMWYSPVHEEGECQTEFLCFHMLTSRKLPHSLWRREIRLQSQMKLVWWCPQCQEQWHPASRKPSLLIRQCRHTQVATRPQVMGFKVKGLVCILAPHTIQDNDTWIAEGAFTHNTLSGCGCDCGWGPLSTTTKRKKIYNQGVDIV